MPKKNKNQTGLLLPTTSLYWIPIHKLKKKNNKGHIKTYKPGFKKPLLHVKGSKVISLNDMPTSKKQELINLYSKP